MTLLKTTPLKTTLRCFAYAATGGWALMLSAPGYPAGLQITEQTVTGLGRAFASGSLANDDASAPHYNPADMMLSRGIQAQTGLTFLGISMEATNAGSSTRLPANLGAVLTQPGTPPVWVTRLHTGFAQDDSGTDNLAPNAYLMMDVNERLRFGLAVIAPFAVATRYSRNWIGRYHAVDSDLLTVDINPSLAYRFDPHLSLGLGVSAQYVDATLSQALFNPYSPFVKDGYAEVQADGWGFGYNFGLLYEFSPNTRIGVSYRSRVNHSAKGKRTISDYLEGRNGQVDAQAKVTLPDWLGLAFYHRLNEQWALMGSLRWTHWSLFKKLQIDFADGSQSLTPENWRNSASFNLGVSYDYTPEWTFRAGYVYDQTPVPSAEYRTPRIPDSDRNAFGLGLSYHPSDQLSVDIGYLYIRFKDAHSENTLNLLPAPVGLITDTLRMDYSAQGHLGGMQLSYRF